MNTETIKIKYHTDEIEKLRYIDGKSDSLIYVPQKTQNLKQESLS